MNKKAIILFILNPPFEQLLIMYVYRLSGL